jgi:hypothetical protein
MTKTATPRKRRGKYKSWRVLYSPRGCVRLGAQDGLDNVVFVENWRATMRFRRQVAKARAVQELASATRGLAEGLNRMVDALSPDKPRPPKGAA